MFSGIIEHVGEVTTADRRPSAMDLRVASGFTDLQEGESIAVNGVCLTATRFTPQGEVEFHLSGETLDRTGLGALQPGARVNLERAVSLATRLSGHIVQGHVDGLGWLSAIEPAGDSHDLQVFLPASLRRYVVEKGSITIDGISLTVNAVYDSSAALSPFGKSRLQEGPGFEIGLMIIPHTWAHTRLSTLRVGDPVNVEVDVLAKYVETLLQHGGKPVSAFIQGEPA
ncbi:riboflavin synthase [Oecophyllibacter saccharovorans]|uniref:riboflavin synthase n=1 Tax=Oecophyllibacter saccharovorans TaxID=2558360 RepID=UPI0011428878|nr:riboflavin synthase [Oecophyllibacter saccharovorans]QDH15983.1 riboflavin synthase [Oecophyllibacter saccharovorans]